MTEQLALLINEAPRQERAAPIKPAVAFHTRRQPMNVGEALRGEQKARRQDALVLHVLQRAATTSESRLTPSRVYEILRADLGPRAPLLTSVRRSLTNLSTPDPARWPAGPPLQHHPKDRRPGPRGSSESVWSLR